MKEVKARLELNASRIVISYYNKGKRVRNYSRLEYNKPLTNQYLELIKAKLGVGVSNIRYINKDQYGYTFKIKEKI